MKDKPFFARSVTRTAAFLTAACLALTCLAGCKGDAIAAAQPVNSVFSDSVATAAATAFHRTADAANRQNAPQSGGTSSFEVTVTPANVRSGPGTNYAKLGRLEKGKKYAYLASKKDSGGRLWYQIKLSSNQKGWVMASLGKLNQAAATTSKTATTSKATTTTTPKSVSQVEITVTPANVRSGPGTNYAKLGQLQKNKRYDYLESKKDKNGKVWYHIQLPANRTGWVLSSLGKLIKTAETTASTVKPTATETTDTTTTTKAASSAVTFTVTATPANVRSGPGTNYAKLGRLEKGKKYTYLATKKDAKGNTWYQIRLSTTKTGWALSTLGKLSSAAATTAAKTTKTTAKKDNTPKYYIVVYKGSQSTVVYGKDDKGKYTKIVKTFTCSTGASSSPTRSGTYHIRAKYRWRLLQGNVYGQYSSSISTGYLFHSVPYNRQSPSTMSYNDYDKLGTPASHGCIRMCVRDCKWIYDNCAIGTEVKIVNDSGPAGPGVPRRSNDSRYRRWDPSDKWAKGNPYFA